MSVANGRGWKQENDRGRLIQSLIVAGIPTENIRFPQDGPDVRAISDMESWRVECKGIGIARPQTHRNSFDRAVASVVSYYEGVCLDAQRTGTKPCLALAVPAADVFLRMIQNRVGQALRERINLWILLYRPHNCSIRAYSPAETVAA
ncbi:MAG: hypothetical protein ACYC26_10495 [Phycisphaerales bacterium]